MTVAELETLETVADETRTRKLARREEKLARKLAQQQERAARVSVCQKSEMEGEALARMLEELAESVRFGRVSVKDEDHEAVLKAIGPASVCVKARRGRKRMRMSLRVCWMPIEFETPIQE